MPESKEKAGLKCFQKPVTSSVVPTVVCILLTWALGLVSIARESEADLKDWSRVSALRSVSMSATVGFESSLEMRGNVDFLLVPPLFVRDALPDGETAEVYFDAILELDSHFCRTHTILFARCWVSTERYRLAVVWAEPHAGSLNFPIYPPTLNIISTPDDFAIRHQLQHTYDVTFAKPLGPRGPFTHRFNTYGGIPGTSY